MSELCLASARELARLIRERHVSARDVMAAHLERIARHNPTLNAIVAKLSDERCLQLADAADKQLSSPSSAGDAGAFHGLPVAFKDTEPVVGFPWTQGSRIFCNVMPAADSTLVARVRGAGAIPIGKTNVPEFAMGSHTFNDVYGATRNPYDITKTAGGSTGGGAAAVATGMLPFADGSDLGGSIRNPANYNNIVGLRPGPGVVPPEPGTPSFGFSVRGPLARTVDDAAWVLSVMSGRAKFAAMRDRSFAGVRLAWCPDLGGLPLDAEVRAVLESQRATFASLGCIVEDACPDLAGAEEIFLTIRRRRSWDTYGPLLAAHRDTIKPEAVAEIESGAQITDADVAAAIVAHRALSNRVREFQTRYPFLACAVNQVPPFAATLRFPQQVDGVAMDSYISWMRSAFLISATLCPAISVPAGFTPAGLPVGVQLVGPAGEDVAVLQLAREFERASGAWRPPAILTSAYK
jgi:amidase